MAALQPLPQSVNTHTETDGQLLTAVMMLIMMMIMMMMTMIHTPQAGIPDSIVQWPKPSAGT